MNYEDFFQVYGDHGHWKRRQAEMRGYFEPDLRRALTGCPEGFHEIAIYGAACNDKGGTARTPTRWRAALRTAEGSG